MPGVPGAGGPVPKRSDQRRRTNERPMEVTKAEGAAEVVIPPADPEWNAVAIAWYESLERSGQSAFYEPSDWGTAYLLAEAMSRELNPQPMTVGSGEHAHVEMVKLPPKGASLAAWLKGMTALMVTEGDRRRAAMELQRPQPAGEGEGNADVAWLDDARQRLGGAS